MRLLRSAVRAAADRDVIRAAASGLVQVLAGPDPAPAWRSRRTRRAAIVLAGLGVIALVLAGVAALLAASRSGAPGVSGFRAAHPGFGGILLLVPLLAAPLPLAVRYPLSGWRIGYLTALLLPLVPGESKWDPGQIAVLLVVFCVAGLRHPRAVLWWMWALMLLPVWLWTGPDWVKPAELTAGLTVVTVALDAVAAWRRARSALADQAARTELEQARRGVLEERARIARELHDVVAHHMSLIAVQAETAPFRLAGLSEPVRAEFGSLSAAAREALADMRRLLGVLRSDEPAERAPQPQLSDLPGLAAAARRAGVRVDLTLPAVAGRVPPQVGVCAYRVIQEALSNAGRHAAGAPVTVTVQQDAGALRLRAVNARGAPAGDRGTTAELSPNGERKGLGLAGMHERVALLGGSLTAGPTPDGGFAVSAVLPLDGAE